MLVKIINTTGLIWTEQEQKKFQDDNFGFGIVDPLLMRHEKVLGYDDLLNRFI